MADEELNGSAEEDAGAGEAGEAGAGAGEKSKARKHDSGVADLERVTDYAEEKEISSQDISGALSLIGDRRNKETAERLEREKELSKVSVKKDDIDLIVREMEISRTTAERTLREHRGDLVAALTTLTN